MYFCKVNPIQQIFSINNDSEFEEMALAIFKHQAEHCAVYASYIRHLDISPAAISKVKDIPYLPISFFKTHEVLSDDKIPEIVFSSSGTTGMVQSRHLVTDVSIYDDSFNRAFELFYGKIEDTCLLALLPSYLERDGSSLIYMVDALLKQSKHPDSGYFLHNHDELYQRLKKTARQ